MELLKVTVVRSKWNGNKLGRVDGSMLLNGGGLMCCLGFACIAAGLSENDIKGHGYVHEIGSAVPESLMKLVYKTADAPHPDDWEQTTISTYLTRANDNGSQAPTFETMADKEAYIIEKGRLAGIEFTFVD